MYSAKKIGQNLVRNISLSGEDNKVPNITVKTPCAPKFEPVKGRRRQNGTGCISEINDHLYEGRYSPRLPDGKRISKNVYAKTREECEIKLAEMIETMKAEIEN